MFAEVTCILHGGPSVCRLSDSCSKHDITSVGEMLYMKTCLHCAFFVKHWAFNKGEGMGVREVRSSPSTGVNMLI